MPDLAAGCLDRVWAEANENDRWLIVRRGSTTIMANFADRPQTLDPGPGRARDLLLSSNPYTSIQNETIYLAPESVAVLGRK